MEEEIRYIIVSAQKDQYSWKINTNKEHKVQVTEWNMKEIKEQKSIYKHNKIRPRFQGKQFQNYWEVITLFFRKVI